MTKDLKSLFKSLDFAAVGGAAVADSESESIADDAAINNDDDDSEDDDDESDEDESDDEVVATPVVAAKVETKHDREERRKAERDELRAKEKAEKDLRRQEMPQVVMPKIKSAWVSKKLDHFRLRGCLVTAPATPRHTSLGLGHALTLLPSPATKLYIQVVDPTPQWYAVPLPTFPAGVARPSPATAGTLGHRASILLERENSIYSSSLSPKANGAAPPPNGLSKADQVFIQQILTSGTSSDKVSALLLLVSSSPLHTTAYLDQLAALCKKKSRDESGRAVRGVVQWWCGDGGAGGGSPSRKLRAFADQPGLGAVAAAVQELDSGKAKRMTTFTQEEVDRCLTIWAFEDFLKKWFFEILKALESMSVDPLPHPRTLSIMHLSNLLRDKPEQEANILRLLVNKLGDSQRGIASKTSHHLLQILQVHPGMTPILVREVSALILRPPASAAPAAAASGSHKRFEDDEKKAAKIQRVKDTGHEHARYYGVITLNQVMLNKTQGEVAGKMIEVYFEIFGDILGRVKDEDEKEKDKEDKVEQKKKFDKRNKGGKGKAGEADVQEGEVVEADSKLIAAVLTGINRAFPFAKLEDESFKQRLDTLFRITHTGTFNVSIQALMLIFHVSASKRAVTDRFYRALYASLYDPRLAGSSKQALYLNLVFKAAKQDSDKKRVMAIVKRLVQVMLGMDVTFILGSIWIVGELMATIPGFRRMITHPEDLDAKLKAAQAAAPAAEDGTPAGPVELESIVYDGRKREPQFAHAENSCLWEVIPLVHHWHPSVALHAEQLLSGKREASSSTEDLEQHSLNHFLDRFVYREAKKSAVTKGASMMQSGVAGQDKTGRIVIKKGAARGEDAQVNSDRFKQKKEQDVPVDQRFFHKYFAGKQHEGNEKAKASKKRRKGKKGDDSDSDSDDEESIGDAGFERDDGEDGEMEADLAKAMAEAGSEDDSDEAMEDEIWKQMKKTMPKAHGDSDDNAEDPDMSDEDDDDLAQYDYSDSDEEAVGGAEAEDVPFKSAFGSDEDGLEDDDDDNLIEDDDDVFGSDEEVAFGDSEDEGAAAPAAKGGKRSKNEDRKQKKRKLNSLPMFGTAEDFAHLLGGSDDEDI